MTDTPTPSAFIKFHGKLDDSNIRNILNDHFNVNKIINDIGTRNDILQDPKDYLDKYEGEIIKRLQSRVDRGIELYNNYLIEYKYDAEKAFKAMMKILKTEEEIEKDIIHNDFPSEFVDLAKSKYSHSYITNYTNYQGEKKSLIDQIKNNDSTIKYDADDYFNLAFINKSSPLSTPLKYSHMN